MALRPFLLLLLAATLLITQVQALGSSALDCCLKYSLTDIPRGMVASYRHQGPESGCLLRAVVFTTKKNRKICASPTNHTVRKLIQYLDKKAKSDNNREKGQTQRPKGRPRKQRQQRV